MIVTVISEGACEAKMLLAERLATQRGQAGRKVLLMDADSQPHPPLPLPARTVNGKGVGAELENLGQRFQDIVVDADGRDSLGSRAALIAARVVVIPADNLRGDAVRAARLAERIGNARLFNPGLRIVIVPGVLPISATLRERLPGAEVTAGGDALYACVFRN